MNNNDIEENMKYINLDLDILINNIINLPELTATAIVLNKQPLLLKFQAILTDAYRLQAKANKYDRLVEKIKEVRNSLEKDGFVGYADELMDILEEE